MINSNVSILVVPCFDNHLGLTLCGLKLHNLMIFIHDFFYHRDCEKTGARKVTLHMELSSF